VSKSKPGTPQLGSCFNALSVLLVAGTCLSLAVVAVVFAAPGIVPEPFRASTAPDIATLALLPTLAAPPSPTETSLLPVFPPTWTPAGTPTVTLTRTPPNTPTATLTPTPTSTVTPTPTITLTPSKTLTPTPTGPSPTPSITLSPFNYLLQGGHPIYMQNWANQAGCSWLGIAGQAFDLSGRPVQGLYVHLEGVADVATGNNQAYGPGGYEIYINNHVMDNSYRIQLRDAAGHALSDWYTIPTFNDCSRNLVLVNFVQNH
jgi:hypothetical protein